MTESVENDRPERGRRHCKNVIKRLASLGTVPFQSRACFAGIRNLFDEDYWGEVREEGIMPALPRNYYGGFEIFF
jgi:hypothetical protein